MANKEKLLALADFIVSNTDKQWDIRYPLTCYIEWANVLWPNDAPISSESKAANELELTRSEVNELFFPSEADEMLRDFALGKEPDLWITREVAADTLRNFANTGVIRFVRPLPD